jgi:hypothetical protein
VLAAVLAMSAAFAISDPSLPEGVVRRLDMVQEALGIFFGASPLLSSPLVSNQPECCL